TSFAEAASLCSHSPPHSLGFAAGVQPFDRRTTCRALPCSCAFAARTLSESTAAVLVEGRDGNFNDWFGVSMALSRAVFPHSSPHHLPAVVRSLRSAGPRGRRTSHRSWAKAARRHHETAARRYPASRPATRRGWVAPSLPVRHRPRGRSGSR